MGKLRQDPIKKGADNHNRQTKELNMSLATKDERNNDVDEIGWFLIVYIVATSRNSFNLAIRVESFDLFVIFRLDVVRSASSDEKSRAVEFAKIRVVDPLGQGLVQEIDVESPFVVFRTLRITNQVLKEESSCNRILGQGK